MGVETGQAEFDLRISSLGPSVVGIRIQTAEIIIEHIQLALDLCIGDVLGRAGVHHVKHHRDGDDRILAGRALLGHHGSPSLRVLFNALLGIRIFLEPHHFDVLFVGVASPRTGEVIGRVTARKAGGLSGNLNHSQKQAEEERDGLVHCFTLMTRI